MPANLLLVVQTLIGFVCLWAGNFPIDFLLSFPKSSFCNSETFIVITEDSTCIGSKIIASEQMHQLQFPLLCNFLQKLKASIINGMFQESFFETFSFTSRKFYISFVAVRSTINHWENKTNKEKECKSFHINVVSTCTWQECIRVKYAS